MLADQQQCAVHVALGSRDPDHRQVGDRVVGGGRAGSRGATREAAVLAGHALRLTPRARRSGPSACSSWPTGCGSSATRRR